MANETEEVSFGDQQRQSMTERVEALFMPDDEEPQEAPQEEPQDEPEDQPEAQDDELDPVETEPVVEGDDLVEVEFEGQLIEAPKAVAEALMRNKDYTQKTQQVAADAKALEVRQGEVALRAEQFAFAESVQPDILKAQQLEAQAQQAHEYLRNNIDQLSTTEIEKLRMAVEDSRSERDELVQSMQQKQVAFQQAQEQSKAELLKTGTEALRSRIPGWGEEGQKAVREYALKTGYTEAEISQVVDPRHVEVLWKASQYDHLQEGKVAAVNRVTGAPQIKPKSRNPMPEGVKSKLKLRKTLKNPKLSSRAKARAIEKDFGERFG